MWQSTRLIGIVMLLAAAANWWRRDGYELGILLLGIGLLIGIGQRWQNFFSGLLVLAGMIFIVLQAVNDFVWRFTG